jgi:Fe-S-cluster containining protein
MVEIRVSDNTINYIRYSKESNLSHLAEAVEAARKTKGLKTSACEGCGICCRDVIPLNSIDIERLSQLLGERKRDFISRYIDLPEPPKMVERERGIRDLTRNFDLGSEQAVLLYELNQAIPAALKKNEDGTCVFLHNNLCSIYPQRPYACMLYNCIMGEKLDQLYENITALGTWAAYSKIGWIDAEAIPHNPFISRRRIETVPLSPFLDIDLRAAREKLFSFF